MNRLPIHRRARQGGFTLVELAITVIMIGVITVLLAPIYNSYVTASRRAYDEKQTLTNLSIGKAMMSYAANSTSQGRLPANYTGSGFTKTVSDPGNAAFTASLNQEGIPSSEVNTDGFASNRVRVYQLVQGLITSVPLYFQSGPLTTLYYDYGAVYVTDCAFANATCNPTPATGVPGTSPLMTSGNYSTWKTSGTDSDAYIISTLPLQKAMLASTVQRLDKVREAVLSYLRAQQLTAAPTDATNWFPPNPGTMGGQNPATNQGCRDGWYDLSTSTVLATIGLAKEEFGSTAWGGRVEFCRDYDPTGTKVPNAIPHYAAVRINKTPSTGSVANSPDPAVIGNNIILTF